MVSFILLKPPNNKTLNKGYGPLGHLRRPAGREQTWKSLNVGHFTRQKISNNLFRLEVHLWDSVIPVDINKLAKGLAEEKERG